MGSPFAQSPQGLASQGSGTMEVVRGIWPVMISLFLSGVVGIMVFPFFTYVPSSGWLNDLLPKVSLDTVDMSPQTHSAQETECISGLHM